MEELPYWLEGSAAVLCVSGPHAIPVSTAVRVDPKWPTGAPRCRAAAPWRWRDEDAAEVDPKIRAELARIGELTG